MIDFKKLDCFRLGQAHNNLASSRLVNLPNPNHHTIHQNPVRDCTTTLVFTLTWHTKFMTTVMSDPTSKVSLLKQHGFWFSDTPFSGSQASAKIYDALCGSSENLNLDALKQNAYDKALELFQLCIKHESRFHVFRHNPELAFSIVNDEWESFVELAPSDVKIAVMAYMKARESYDGKTNPDKLVEAADHFASIWSRLNQQVLSEAGQSEFQSPQQSQFSPQTSSVEASADSVTQNKTYGPHVGLNDLPTRRTHVIGLKTFLCLLSQSHCMSPTSNLALYDRPLAFLRSDQRKASYANMYGELKAYGDAEKFVEFAHTMMGEKARQTAMALLTDLLHKTGKVVLLRRLEDDQGTQAVLFDTAKVKASQ